MANKLLFKNPDVDAVYSCNAETEKHILVPGHYSGPLSGITKKAADYMLKVKDPHLTLKKEVKPVASEKSKEIKT